MIIGLVRSSNYIKPIIPYYVRAQATTDLLNYSSRITNITFFKVSHSALLKEVQLFLCGNVLQALEISINLTPYSIKGSAFRSLRQKLQLPTPNHRWGS